MKVSQLYISCCVKISAQKYELGFFCNFSRHEDRICFLDSMSQLLLPLPYEAKLGTKLKKERNNDVATVVTIIKTTKNRTKAKNKNLNSLWAASRKRFFRAIS